MQAEAKFIRRKKEITLNTNSLLRKATIDVDEDKKCCALPLHVSLPKFLLTGQHCHFSQVSGSS